MTRSPSVLSFSQERTRNGPDNQYCFVLNSLSYVLCPVVFLGQITSYAFKKGGKRKNMFFFSSFGLEKESDLLTQSFAMARLYIIPFLLKLFPFVFTLTWGTIYSFQDKATQLQKKLLSIASCKMFNLPGAFVINSMTSGLFDVLVATFSRASNLFLCSFTSNSTLKNPKQYNMIDSTEIIEAKEGKFSFVTVISVISSSFNNLRRCFAQWKVLLYTVSACYVILTSRVWVVCQVFFFL